MELTYLIPVLQQTYNTFFLIYFQKQFDTVFNIFVFFKCYIFLLSLYIFCYKENKPTLADHNPVENLYRFFTCLVVSPLRKSPRTQFNKSLILYSSSIIEWTWIQFNNLSWTMNSPRTRYKYKFSMTEVKTQEEVSRLLTLRPLRWVKWVTAKTRHRSRW